MRNQTGTVQLIYLISIIISIAVAVGWVKNIIKLTDCDFEAPYKAEVIHTIGIIPPVGAFTGYMDLGK